MSRFPTWLAIAVFGALLLLPGLGRMGAFESTDARYLAIAREMWATRDWLMPSLGGVPHLDKPPLAYWVASLGYALFGPTEFGGRFGEQLALIGTALLVAHAARRFGDAHWAAAAGLIFLTMGLPFAVSRGLETDLFQLFFVTAALVAILEAALQGSARLVAAAGAILGASMLAKGPIGLMIVAAVWLVFAVCVRERARLPWRGIAVGFSVFVVIGLPWYLLLMRRNPALFDWFLHVQLASRVTGTNRGHIKDAAYFARVWPLGLLPWTPLVALALWRLRPRGRWRDADPTAVFLLAWAVVPVALFSLFKTKLPTYILPAFPGAALLVARAGNRGQLDDRIAQVTILVTAGLVALSALVIGIGISGESGLGFDLVPKFSIEPSRTSLVCGLLLIAIGAAGLAALARARALGSLQQILATAAAAGLVLALAYQALAPAFPTLREQGRLVASVPGARLIEFSLKPSLFFYADAEGKVTMATVNGVVESFVDPKTARRMTQTRDDAVAMLREDVPTFAFIHDEGAAALAKDTDTTPVSRTRDAVLLANPAALRAMQAAPVATP